MFQKRTLEPNNEEESHLFDENETFLSELVKKEAWSGKLSQSFALSLRSFWLEQDVECMQCTKPT